jgi:retinol dehydrogenase-12
MAASTPGAAAVSLSGRVALVTGANSGIGRVTAVELALRGYHVFLACRDAGKTAEVLDEIAQRSGGTARAEFIALDLGDLDSVRQCAQAFNARQLPLHLLVNNAGLAGQKGFTTSGFELAFGVCHIGHFLLTRLLLDRLKQAAPSRVVVVASRAHTATPRASTSPRCASPAAAAAA